MLLMAGIATILLQSGCITAAESPRERISIKESWRFHNYNAQEKADGLIYDVRPQVRDTDDAVVADEMPTEAVEVEATQTILEPWILPTGNDFIKDPAKRHVRPKGNPGSDFPYVQGDFNDSSWESVNLPHDWAITGPFFKGWDAAVGGGMGRLPSPGVAWYRKKLDIPAANAGKSIFHIIRDVKLMATSQVHLTQFNVETDQDRDYYDAALKVWAAMAFQNRKGGRVQAESARTDVVGLEVIDSQPKADVHCFMNNGWNYRSSSDESTAPLSGPVCLAGEWRFALDSKDVGIDQRWFSRDLADHIQLPGALQHQGYGDQISTNTPWVAKLIDRQWYKKEKYSKYIKPGNVLVPFLLQPPRHYVGAAWYQRDITIPAPWQGRRVVLTLERPHWETQVWLDEKPFGNNRSLGTPHVYDLGTGLTPGRHRLTVRVDNRMIVDVGSDAHSISDQTQTCWNGIVGRLELSATSAVWIENVQVYPNVAKKSALLKVRIGNATGRTGQGTLTVLDQSRSVSWDVQGSETQIQVNLGADAKMWDEFDPVLHTVTVALTGDNADDTRTVTFGLRQVGTEGRYLTMNGKRFLSRGTLECAIFPLTGYPPTDVDSWRRIVRTCKEYGLNHIRFHSWCPPEAAFEAADQLGCYLQVECGIWARGGTRLGYGDPVDQWLYEETDAILSAYGNHPSFVFLSHGNEPKARTEFLASWVRYVKEKDPRQLYTSATGWGQTEQNQYDVFVAVGGRQGRRIRGESGWRGADYREGLAPAKVPTISHEIGQFCAYPDFSQIAKYTGVLTPGNLMIFGDFAQAGGILKQNSEIAYASGRLQVLCYKEEIEAALRTRDQAGFQLLDLHDFPGQGTALVGVLDAFWDSKGYTTSEEYRRFCGPTVPLARLAKRVFTTAEILETDVEISHFGRAPLENAVPFWKLIDVAGQVAFSGELPSVAIPLGGGTHLGRVQIELSKLNAPGEYRLVIGLKDTSFENGWSIWLYPAKVDLTIPAGVTVATRLDSAVLAELEKGGTVILFPERIGRAHPPVSFVPVFWNNQMFPNESRQTLGVLCDPKHPALAQFPTRGYSEWNWEDIVQGARAFDCATLPRELRPIIQVIDDWNTGRKLALAFECKVGSARLLVSGANLIKLAQRSPAARQLQYSLLAYVTGTSFKPEVALTTEQVRALLDQETKAKGTPPATGP